ncbi:MFS transporter [Exiguobacterium sp. Leaf187]|uniref:MFS transporter n=1 Tax=Exiguobacterium sp. Leaf187 TaxID=1736294 RepID=UPI0006FE2016|nr:MFS transporter [Exiguobacterium sp. Leaf187]KQS18635.1 MFS transporter [Exiguobacterium sp. Leaf187]
MFRLLTHPSFLFLLLGRVVTNIGDSLYYVASMWLVFELSHNPFYTGLAGFLILVPKVLQFLIGPLVDRWRVKPILISTQVLQAVLLMTIPIAYYLDALHVSFLLCIMPLLACIEEFAYPAQTKTLPLLLKKEDLLHANSLFAIAYQGIDLILNSLGAILVASFGAIFVFWIDSITFVIAALCFSLVKIPRRKLDQDDVKEKQSSIKRYVIELREGFHVVLHSLLWVFTIGSLLANFTIGMTLAILPSFSDQIGGVGTYGFLLTAISAGSLMGAFLGPLLGRFRIGSTAILCFTLGGLCWIVAGWMTSPILICLLFGVAWIPVGAVNILFAGLIQAAVPHEILGRTTSITYSISVSAMPIGSLVGGSLANYLGSSFIFSFSGIGLILISFVWLLHPQLRQLSTQDTIDASVLKLPPTSTPPSPVVN